MPSSTNASAGGSSAQSSSSKWKVVRPWHPPAVSSRSSEAALEAGQGETGIVTEDEDEEDDDTDGQAEQESRPHSLTPASDTTLPSRKRRQLEVIDVSSTSVSLAVYGATEETAIPANSHANARPTNSTIEATANPPNFSVKLNSTAWPHFFHSDTSIVDADGTEALEDAAPSSSSILVWGLSPGTNYQIELGVIEEPDEAEDDAHDLEDASDSGETEEPLPTPASGRAIEPGEPDVPPPPYSSHDPSLPANGPSDAEINLRNMLEQLRVTSKQAEGTLSSSIAALRRANDKLTREDQRHRQRIHMLEDSTARLREVAQEEEAECTNVHEAISELEESEQTFTARLERRKAALEALEKDAREESEREESEIVSMKNRLEALSTKEEEVLGQKVKLERELLPMHNIQLATLEADIRRVLDDHQRRQYLSMQQHNQHYGGIYHGPGNGQGSIGRSAAVRMQNRNNLYYDMPSATQGISAMYEQGMPPQSAHSTYDPSVGGHQQTGASQPRERTGPAAFLSAGLRKRSVSLTKPEEKHGQAAVAPSVVERKGESEAKSGSRFAWTNNTWASRVSGKNSNIHD